MKQSSLKVSRVNESTTRSAAGVQATSREQLLLAAERCVERFGPQKLSMDDVAREAGLSRATLYRTFARRDDLLIAVAERQCRDLAKDAFQHLVAYGTISEWIVEGMLFVLREVPKRPVLALLVTRLDTSASGQLFLGARHLLELGIDVLRPAFNAAREKNLLRAEVELELLMDWILRILWTYLSAPSQVVNDNDGMRRVLHSLLIPSLLAEPPASKTK